nr:hypothetical protein [Tanacetum cinerariifolium]
MASNLKNVRLSILAKLQEALDEEDILADQILTMMHRYADRFTNRRVEINNLMSSIDATDSGPGSSFDRPSSPEYTSCLARTSLTKVASRVASLGGLGGGYTSSCPPI